MTATGALAAWPGCRSHGGEPRGGRVKVGLVVPQAGVYAPLGTDMKHAWEFWLERHGGKLGRYEVTTILADEGETPQTGVPAIQKLLQNDQVDVIAGIVSSSVALGAKDLVTEAKKLLIVGNAGAGAITGAARSPYIWRTSFTNAQVGAVMGKHLASLAAIGPVYAIAPDYAAGTEVIQGFRTTFEAGGGKIAGLAKPALGKTSDYQPFLTGIQASGARATFCFFSGAEAVAFVKQYAQFGLAAQIPLYGLGFLTEGSMLAAQGDAALGIETTLQYSTELDIPANKEFVAAWTTRFNAAPAVFSVQMWDAANVLDRALAVTTGLDGDSLAKAMGSLGTIADSPRGPWSFEGQSPRQKFYLRKVEKRGTGYVNAVVAELGEFSPMV
ncbi:MAG TPA: ABC transporter substrate-binding protein [Kofleriaceae bacterium]|nr:ABC transporter substrate-binding protein [Kofleriaceae bacterium]